ncbi:MAG: PAS domain S-box protein [Chloroflexi bacterium]|nr:PAS domain S-box protein [Chloroflexota bacterium]
MTVGPEHAATGWLAAGDTGAQAARWAEAVARVATAVTRAVEVAPVVSVVLDQAVEMLGARAAHVYLVVEDRRELRLAGQRNLPEDLAARLERIAFDTPFLAARAASTQAIQIVEDADALDPALTIARAVLARTGSASMLSVPLLAFDHLVGVLTFTLPVPHHFLPHELAALHTIAEIFAVGIANAQAFERERLLRGQVEAVRHAALAISEEFGVRAVLQTIVEHARTVASAQYAALGVGTDPTRPFDPWVFSGISPEQAAAVGRVPRPVGLLGAVSSGGQAIRLSHVAQDLRYAGLPPGHPVFTSFLGVPIRYRGRSLGNLYLANKVGAEAFTEADQRAVELLAQHAALALEHTRVHEQMAEEIAERKRSEEALQNSERTVRALYEATSSQHLSFAEKVQALLAMGCQRFALSTGMLARIEDERYEVVEVHTPDTGIRKGDIFALGQTYCRNTLQAGEPIGFAHAGASAWQAHPCYAEFHLEAYLGAPVMVQGRAYGTLNFSSLQPRQQPFTSMDIGLVRLMAQWVGAEIERRLAEEEREQLLAHEQATAQHLAAVLRAATEYAIIGTDPNGVVTVFNAGAERVLGYRADEVIGKLTPMAWHDPQEMAARATELGLPPGFGIFVATALRGGAETREWTFIRKNGARRTALLTVTAMRDHRGAITGFLGIANDITERRTAEARFRQLLEAAPDAIVVVGADGRITVVNSQAERLFGYAREELLGQPVEVLIPARLRERHVGHRARYAAQPQTRPMGVGLDLYGRRKDGSEFPTEISLSPIDDGSQVSVISVIRDITVRKQAEEQLRQTAAELERSNADLQQFAYVASHDLQEPLRMVASFTQLLARRYRGRLDADADTFIAFVVDGATRMQRLIEDLLAYSRVGTQGRPFEPTNVGAVVDRVLSELSAAITEHGATVTRDPLPTVMADPIQLGQVFQNLISNAIKFHQDAPPRVHVSTERQGREWRFSVRDNGIGIDPRYADRIFVIFQRLHAPGEFPGTGIGLAICKKIVERHGGRIWVASAPGEGATFSFTIPERQA